MNEKVFTATLLLIALAFTVFFAATIIPPLLADPNLIEAILAGFVNPFASGYSTDVILCWLVLFVWVLYEKSTLSIKGGWICLLLGAVPGVAVGFSLYLVMRMRQIKAS